jgi:hypothetical protein
MNRRGIQHTTVVTAVVLLIAVGNGACATGTWVGIAIGSVTGLAVIGLATFLGPSRE